MIWKMFIDDERFPVESDQVIVRSVQEAQVLIQEQGCPIEINFDHDLGDNVPSGFDLAKWLVEKDLDENGNFFPENFCFYVHSQNPTGRKNIEGLLYAYLDQRNNETNKPIKIKI